MGTNGLMIIAAILIVAVVIILGTHEIIDLVKSLLH